ncbi:MAG: hypothetical protein GY835_18745, partial [bacterium]|nr:hypothetical protein [bacterium]
MLEWWEAAGIAQADLAVRRPDGAMIWHHGLSVSRLPLAWARAENVRRAEVYIRPARGHAWPLLFLDDVDATMALRIAGKYDALLIRTSPSGGCHVWLRLARPLNEAQRCQAQRRLARLIDADPGSVSGEHLGRLAGTKNWKRNGVWVNVVSTRQENRPPWEPSCIPRCRTENTPSPSPACQKSPAGVDCSESGKEWGWVCGALEAGLSPDAIYQSLVEKAGLRRGRDAERYARFTIN